MFSFLFLFCTLWVSSQSLSLGFDPKRRPLHSAVSSGLNSGRTRATGSRKRCEERKRSRGERRRRTSEEAGPNTHGPG